MKKLVVHIGTPKTGSTTLQAFLASKELENVGGVFYPKCFILGKKNATFLLFAQDSQQFIEGTNAIKEVLVKNDLVIISEEILSFHYVYNDVPFNNNGFVIPADVTKNILYLIKEFPDVKVEFLVYLRRQDSYIESEIKETIKGYGKYVASNSALTFNDAFKEYIVTKEKMLDYGKWVGDLIKLVGKDNVKIKSFDKCIKTGLIKDFANTYNINLPIDILNQYERYENKSPSLTYLYLLNTINNNSKYHYLLKNIESYKDIKDQTEVSLFSKKDAESLVNKYKNGNMFLEDCLDLNESLFSYDFSNYPSQFNQNSKYVRTLFKNVIKDTKHREKANRVQKPNIIKRVYRKIFNLFKKRA